MRNVLKTAPPSAARGPAADMATFNEAINNARAALRAQVAQMEITKVQFLRAANEWLQSVLPKITTQAGRRWHERTLALGTEGVRKLKQDLASVMANLASDIERELGKASLWAHMQRDPGGDRDMTGIYSTGYGRLQRISDQFDRAFRNVVGKVDAVFVEHGYNRDTVGYGAVISLPQSAPAAIYDLIDTYHQQHDELRKLNGDLKWAEDALGQANAGDLWDDV
jgi:hypothetical protein